MFKKRKRKRFGNIGKDDIEEVIANIEGFDFTELEIEEVGKAIAPALERREHWITFGPVSCCGINRFKCKVEKLGDEKLYPVCYIDMEFSITGQTTNCIVELNPFGCEEVRGDKVYATASNVVSEAFKEFMHKKFGDVYAEANNSYWNNVKESGVEEILNKATKEIQEITDDCNQNLMSL